MCTVSWRTFAGGYSVHFNRDEQKLRPTAETPRVFKIDGVRVTMPIDPKGGGTWCSVNEYGAAVALLNYYQGKHPKGRLISRGHLVKACSAFRTSSQVQGYLENSKLVKFAPFSLLSFSIGDCGSTCVNMFRWNGKELLNVEQRSPLISSAINYDEVHASRTALFNDVSTTSHEKVNDAVLFQLHSSHLPSRSSRSICMHREDAETVSYSHINVTDKKINFSYSDGSPCDTKPFLFSSLKRLQ